jgi:hypothetical protein
LRNSRGGARPDTSLANKDSVGVTEIKPALALGGWAAFHMVAKNDAMVMGDLVLTEEEVAPVMKGLEDGGVEVTALHNHLIGESPRIVYIHMGGHGNPVKIAQTDQASGCANQVAHSPGRRCKGVRRHRI